MANILNNMDKKYKAMHCIIERGCMDSLITHTREKHLHRGIQPFIGRGVDLGHDIAYKGMKKVAMQTKCINKAALETTHIVSRSCFQI